MSHIKLVVDGKVLLDDDLNTWTDRAKPGFVKELLDPRGGKPKLHMMVAGLVLSQLTLAAQSGTITVVTDGDGSWSIAVDTT